MSPFKTEIRIALVRCINTAHRYPSPAAPPLGLMTLAAATKHSNLPVKIQIFDQAVLTNPEKILDRIFDFKPHMAGFNVVENTIQDTGVIAALVKSKLTGCLTIAGGPAADDPERLLDKLPVNYAFAGEGDTVFGELASRCDNPEAVVNMPGIAYRMDGGIVSNEPPPFVQDMDSLPDPVWNLIEVEQYNKLPSMNMVASGSRIMPVMLTRGCPYGCTYCHHRFGKKLRKQSPGRAMDAWEKLEREYRINEVHVFDDCFNHDGDWASEVLEEKIRRGLKHRIAFCNGLRGDRLNEKLISLLARAGTYSVSIGVESADPDIQKTLNKNLDLEKTAVAVRLLASHGVIIRGFFIIGAPGETVAQAKKSYDFAIRLPFHLANFFTLIPFPGTRLMEKYGDLADLSEGKAFYESNDGFGGGEKTDGLAPLFNRRFKMRPGFMLKLSAALLKHSAFGINLVNLIKASVHRARSRLNAGLSAGPVTVEKRINAQPETVHRILTEPDQYSKWIENDYVHVELLNTEQVKPGSMTVRHHKQGAAKGRLLGVTITESVIDRYGFVDRFVKGPIRGTHSLLLRMEGKNTVVSSIIRPNFPGVIDWLIWNLSGRRHHTIVVTKWLENITRLSEEGRQ